MKQTSSNTSVTINYDQSTGVYQPPRLQPLSACFQQLNARAAAKVTVALTRLEQGNVSNSKGVGSGVFELRIDCGPGYRVYFSKDGEHLVILLGGGTKKRQNHDIQTAQTIWAAYKARKKQE